MLYRVKVITGVLITYEGYLEVEADTLEEAEEIAGDMDDPDMYEVDSRVIGRDHEVEGGPDEP